MAKLAGQAVQELPFPVQKPLEEPSKGFLCFVTEFVPKCNIFILGDFNIHDCSPSAHQLMRRSNEPRHMIRFFYLSNLCVYSMLRMLLSHHVQSIFKSMLKIK